MNLTIIYMVAGLSSRFGGKIKPLTEVGTNNETLIEISANQAIRAGFNKIIFIVGEHTEKPFKEKFRDKYKEIPVEYVLQSYNKEKRDKPWGTCDAACYVIEKISEPVVIAGGDDIYGEKTFEILAKHLKNSEDNITIVTELIKMLPENENAVNRGIFEIDENIYVINGREELNISKKNFKERGFNEKSPVSLSIFGLYPETLKLLKEKLDEFKMQNSDDRKAECYLNIKLIELIQDGKIKMKLYFTPERWFGITNPEDEIKIREELKKLKK